MQDRRRRKVTRATVGIFARKIPKRLERRFMLLGVLAVTLLMALQVYVITHDLSFKTTFASLYKSGDVVGTLTIVGSSIPTATIVEDSEEEVIPAFKRKF